MKFEELKQFLDEKADFYNQKSFIELDPIQIPHRFTRKEDQEIAGFLAATISWGNRKSILKSADKMLQLMDNAPYDFVINHTGNDLVEIEKQSVHRTFNGEDLSYFIQRFKSIYEENNSLENLFLIQNDESNFYYAIERFRNQFLGVDVTRSHKHVSSPYKNSSSKRIMMFLRWMVRKDNRGVDLGLWENIDPKFLSIPLDVHTGNVSRNLGLITRKQNDWKTVMELDQIIRKMDENDPSKYDFALFGVGVNKEI